MKIKSNFPVIVGEKIISKKVCNSLIEEITNSKSFEKPQPKGEVTLVAADDIEKLIHLLHNEAKAL